jgi:kinesin family protein 2/24
MDGLLRRGITHLYAAITEREAPRVVSLTAFEIAGKVIRDLLDSSGIPKDVKVMEDKERRTRVLGVALCEACGPEELLALIESAQAHRATRATQVNETSSRSHAVYRIWVENGKAKGDPGAPVLTLVDCAGSERREDSSHHDSQSRKDATEINSTIFALKECFRVMRQRNSCQQPPYRESLLTRVLSDSFSSDQALIIAFGTVSPSATDTEHSIGTIRALQQLQGTQMAFQEREDVAKPKAEVSQPKAWSEDEVRQWLEIAVGGRARDFVSAVSKGTDGKNLVRWPLVRFSQLCNGDDSLGAMLYQDLRQRIKQADPRCSV